MKAKDPRIGCKGGDWLMPVAFRKQDRAFIAQVQLLYREGYYSQKALYEELRKHGYEVSQAIVAKMCRCDVENLEKVDLDSLRELQAKTKPLSLKQRKERKRA